MPLKAPCALSPLYDVSVPIIVSSMVCPFIVHKLSNCPFFQTDQRQQDRVHQARHFLGTCISQSFVSFLFRKYFSLSVILRWELLKFSHENWIFEMWTLLFIIYVVFAVRIYRSLEIQTYRYDMFDIKSCISTESLLLPAQSK